MRFYVGNTDFKWYNYLRKIHPEDVNFWQPGGKTNFKVISPGAPFLLKLKSPYNAIAGVGFFSSHTFLPISVAWDTFNDRNGCETIDELRTMISNYRSEWWDANPTIGCIVLTNPIFFEEADWIEPPANWAKSIVQGKSYETEEAIGQRLWAKVEARLQKYLFFNVADQNKSQLSLEQTEWPMYGQSILTKVRLGQGAFRVLITDAYSRKCSISGEKTLPVLEAAHIKPYTKSGPHFISNGLLLRSDLHKLFDSGYLTITTDFKIEVSNRIRQEFENGKDYYQYHGALLRNIPTREMDKPNKNYIEWHNSNIFKP
ncbi:MAG TPA: HNH endonuclease [Sediminibacterium sp.]|nr:HNH endonuclease [Sediminibacterium sp.]